jgi:CubicO group peptidase (beta-lactamase class C family)
MKNLTFIFLYIFFCSCDQQNEGSFKIPDQLNDEIQTASLKEAGIDEKMMKAMHDSITAGGYTNIHSVLILRNNKLVYENYWPGHDENRETDFIGMTEHGRDSLHDIRSITKTVVSAAIMIAIDQGKIKNVDQRLFDFFPEFAKYDTGLKKQITIRNLLTMSAGLYWGENLSYNDSLKNRSIAEACDFILRQPLTDTPGHKFQYSSSWTQLLAAIVERTTGMNIEKFTGRYLFAPLGITSYKWTAEKNGLFSAWAGLRMRSRDMLKFGMLYLNNGKWNRKQIIPATLVDESMSAQIKTGENGAYGYQFWILKDTIPGEAIEIIEASGNGGQKIAINKDKNLLIVVTAGNYDAHDLRKGSYDLYFDFIFPAIIKLKE